MSRFSCRRPIPGSAPVSLLALACLLGALLAPAGIGRVLGGSPPNHLVISEIVTGGASASDELIELHNPTAATLPLEGLELVYVSATGVTTSRRAAWESGAPSVPPGGHVLVANEAGIFASVADTVYASGIAAGGGSVALRILGASTSIDAVGWGTASSAWIEGTPAAAPAAGSSLERLPGGAAGSGQDIDDNAVDFVERAVPDPQNLASPPTPGALPSPVSSPSSTPSVEPTPIVAPSPPATAEPTPTPSTPPGPVVVSILAARSAANGTVVTVEGTALTASTFTDGGGYVADGSGGIAVLLSSGSFERGARVRITGTIGDRFAQRTLRADAAGVAIAGAGNDPAPNEIDSGAVGEAVEGTLVAIRGRVLGAPTQLSAGQAFEVDDGTGPIRVVVATATGIDTSAWIADASVELVGVVGQRDSSGTGSSGYRVQPRDPSDVRAVDEPTPSGSAAPGTSSAPSPTAATPIADARALPRNTRVTVRGTVTLPPGIVGPGTAAIQDTTGAILLRLGDDAGTVAFGERVEVSGARSTLRGMETLRVTTPVQRLGAGSSPSPTLVRTGDAGEALEAHLVTVRGALVANARRSGSGSVSLEVDDGSGPLRVSLGAALGGSTDGLGAGAWVEVTGVLGQETTGSQPLRGYRLWPRSSGEVRITAAAREADGAGSIDTGEVVGSASGRRLADLGAPDPSAVDVGATLVAGPWPEVGVGGVLWDGRRLAALEVGVGAAVQGMIARAGGPPLAVELRGPSVRGSHERLGGVPVLAMSGAADGLAPRAGVLPEPPRAELPEEGAAWVSLVGRLVGSPTAWRLVAADGPPIPVDLLCGDAADPERGSVQVVGVGRGDARQLLVPCGGLRPAPALATGAIAAVATSDGATPKDADEAASRPALADGSRWIAAILLASGAIGLVVAAVLGRRLNRLGDGSATAVKDVRPPEDHESDGRPAGMPATLTLVSVPRERGSP